MSSDADRIVSLVDGRVDLPTRRVVRHGAAATLTTLEARLLAYLAGRPGEVVSRQTLLEEVWDYNPSVETRAIDQAVWRLRTKIERDAREPRHLLTAHGRGYVFEPVGEAPAAALAVEGAAAVAAAAPALGDEGAFVGRDEELRELAAAFASGVRLVALTGPGGVGKTRLAMELGFRWPGRVVLCDLSDAATEAALVEAVARSLDVVLAVDTKPGAGARVLGRALSDLGPGLVVFDDVDRGVASFPALARRWLVAAPDARFLVTTRRDLDLDGLLDARERPLGGLSHGAGVSLFQARAREALRRRAAEFEAGSDDVGRLVQHVARVPLAIEVAAARAGAMSLGEMVARLDDSVTVAGGDATRGRPAAVHGTLAWSWDLLDDDERRAFSQLSVFRGGADLEAAEAVVVLGAFEADVGAVLARLGAASLVKRRQLEDGLARYALLESVADFAAERLDDDDRDALVARHRGYYLGAAGRAAAALRGRAGVEALAWLQREQANILAAFRRARGEAPEEAARLALAVEPVLAAQGPYERQREVLDAAVEAAAAADAPALSAEALLRRSAARRAAGARAEAQADLEAARALAARSGDGRSRRARPCSRGSSGATTPRRPRRRRPSRRRSRRPRRRARRSSWPTRCAGAARSTSSSTTSRRRARTTRRRSARTARAATRRRRRGRSRASRP
ncbi:MAG: winged helix-turn-helix domain-containing protein [Deltaproteobacteria bacterium]|nr:winged helix-turn-helix domain-containing protein [Deltaproteobacteria bacterium]